MTTSAPIRKIVNIPIVEPVREPLWLSEPDPGRIVVPLVPIRVPVKVGVRR